MSQIRRAEIGALLRDLDHRSPAGCAIGLHIRFTTPRYMFQSYPKRWMDHYSAAGLLVNDPTVRWGMSNVGWVRWTELEKIDDHGVLDLAKDYGIMNGVTIALVLESSRSIASFARSDRDFETAEIAEIEPILVDLHRATASLDPLAAEDRLALKELSIRLTH